MAVDQVLNWLRVPRFRIAPLRLVSKYVLPVVRLTSALRANVAASFVATGAILQTLELSARSVRPAIRPASVTNPAPMVRSVPMGNAKEAFAGTAFRIITRSVRQGLSTGTIPAMSRERGLIPVTT